MMIHCRLVPKISARADRPSSLGGGTKNLSFDLELVESMLQ